VALMMIAHAEARHPALAARDYDIIQGRPSKKAEAMLRDFLDANGKVQWHTLDDTIADATFSHPVGGTARISWDMARAERAGLAGKEMFKKFPRQMLRSRTVSEGVRTVWPLATSGMYVGEEIADFTGQTIDAEPPRSERDAINESVPLRSAATAMPRGATRSAPAAPSNGKTRHSVAPPAGAPDADWRACMDWVAPALAKLRTRETVIEVANGPTCSDIIANGPEWARAELSQLLADNYARFPAEASPDVPELADVEIAGEAKVMAG